MAWVQGRSEARQPSRSSVLTSSDSCLISPTIRDGNAAGDSSQTMSIRNQGRSTSGREVGEAVAANGLDHVDLICILPISILMYLGVGKMLCVLTLFIW